MILLAAFRQGQDNGGTLMLISLSLFRLFFFIAAFASLEFSRLL
jgi:hypothetical protein